MITFFTTFKDFKGQNRVNQLNAIRSWLALDLDIEVMVFSESEGINLVLNDTRIVHIKDIELFEGRVPLIGPMFNRADRIAKNKVCCFINGDIITTKQFLSTVKEVNLKLQENYLLVGQRKDTNVDYEIDFKREWENNFNKKHQEQLKLQEHYMMDYFVFPKGQYSNYIFPTLLVGRPGWDLWMIYNAKTRRINTVDLSPTVTVIHQNHDYGHKVKIDILREKEDNINYQAFPFEEFYFFSSKTCDYSFSGRTLEKNYGRGDNEFFLRMKMALSENKIIVKFLLLLLSKHSALSNVITQTIGKVLFNFFIKARILN